MEKEKLISTVVSAQQGDNDALNSLFNEFYNDLYYFALKTVKDEETALDVTQEAFVEIINTLGNLNEPAAFVTWAKQITYHQCTRYFKKKKDVLVDEDEDGNTVFDTLKEENAEFIPDEALDKDDFKKTIMAILDELSEEQRSATMMYYFDEMSVRQIAEIQGVSEGTVKSRLNYARKAIKTSVEEYEKKNGIKLHAVPFFPLFKWIFGSSFESALPLASAELVAEGVGAATGTAITVSATSATATAVATTTTATAVGIGAKIAGLPLVTKIIAGVVAATIAIGGGTTAVVLSKKNSDNPKSKVSATPDITTESEPVKFEITEELHGNGLTGAQKYYIDNEEFLGRYSFSISFYPNGADAYNNDTDEVISVTTPMVSVGTTMAMPLIPQDVSSSSYYEVWKEETMYILSCGDFIDVPPTTATWDELFTKPEYFAQMDGVEVDGVKYIMRLEGGYGGPGECFDYALSDDGSITLTKRDDLTYGFLGYTVTDLKLEKDLKTLSGTVNFDVGFSEKFKIPLNGIEPSDEEPVIDDDENQEAWNFVVPSSCSYIAADGTEYKEGERVLAFPTKGEKLITPDYIYIYNKFVGIHSMKYDENSQDVEWVENDAVITNWRATVRDKNKVSYEPLLEEIGGLPMDSIYGTFLNCKNMVTSPEIPESVRNLDYAYYGCESLKKAPVLPENIYTINSTFAFCKSLVKAPKIPTMVHDMMGTFMRCKSLETVPNLPANLTVMISTFDGCSSLKKVPKLPSKLQRMDHAFTGCSSLTTISTIQKNVTALPGAFYGCTSLTGEIVINALITKVDEYNIYDCFSGTTLPITLSGTCPVLSDIAATANNGNLTVK